MSQLARPFYADAFSPTLFESPALVVTGEQQRYIREILETACSDSRFAEKAYIAIMRVLTAGKSVVPEVTSLNPASAILGAPSFTLHVLGKGFDVNSVIVWNGSIEPTVYVSATELTTQVDMSTAQVAVDIPVMVQSGDGVLSAPSTFSLTDAAARTATKKPDLIVPATEKK